VKQPVQDKLAQLPKARIVERKNFTDELFILWLETGVPLPFKAGQYVTLGARGLERPYSIASAPHEPRLEIFIEQIPPEHGGKLSPILWAQNVGDELSMRPKARGHFQFEPDSGRDHVMVSTVTGVAPFISMLRHSFHAGMTGHRFFVLEGASHGNELVYDRELSALAERHPDVVRFVPSISRPDDPRNAGWKGRTGRINGLVEEHLAEWGLNPEETLVYTCGHPKMIEDVKNRLLPKGWKVKEERFWREKKQD
jgi:NAD(P)H-flavin reductase